MLACSVLNSASKISEHRVGEKVQSTQQYKVSYGTVFFFFNNLFYCFSWIISSMTTSSY